MIAQTFDAMTRRAVGLSRRGSPLTLGTAKLATLRDHR